jgi:hypothetical protein
VEELLTWLSAKQEWALTVTWEEPVPQKAGRSSGQIDFCGTLTQHSHDTFQSTSGNIDLTLLSNTRFSLSPESSLTRLSNGFSNTLPGTPSDAVLTTITRAGSIRPVTLLAQSESSLEIFDLSGTFPGGFNQFFKSTLRTNRISVSSEKDTR